LSIADEKFFVKGCEVMGNRVILHSDMNCFYASVEMMLNPRLRGKPVAVCGSTEDRHGIVLAKSQLAKQAGVKTGMVNWEAKRCCPGLIVVPPQYDQYLKYSKLARAIYGRFTDQVEPYGMDECWLDVTGSGYAGGNGMEIAEKIRRTVREELGLTVSIGVSFNKIFAKLGSDLKKPDAITEISEENFREKIWPLPASDLLYVGPRTNEKLAKYGIHTIGQLAGTDPDFLRRLLGVRGLDLWRYAAGRDESRVMHQDFVSPVKSIGHGITCTADLNNNEEVWKVMLELSQDVGHRLRVHGLDATGVQIAIRSNELWGKQYQAHFQAATRSPRDLANLGRKLFEQEYQWSTPVRAVCIRAIDLVPHGQPTQMNLFVDQKRLDRRDQLDDAIEAIRRRFGKRSIIQAAVMGDLKMPNDGRCEVTMPGMMYT
jgi:DNA polymerase-4